MLTEIHSELYHGTAEYFDSFREPGIRRDRGAGYDHQGRAVYLTSDPNGYGRFFARESSAKLVVKLQAQKKYKEAEKLYVSDGVVLSVKVNEGARILDITQAPDSIRALFDSSVGNEGVGHQLRQAVLEAGFDGIAFKEPNFPEGWEVAHNAMTVVVYNHSQLTITGCKEADLYELPSGWALREDSGSRQSEPVFDKFDNKTFTDEMFEEARRAILANLNDQRRSEVQIEFSPGLED
ncbi:hypothetical protein JHL22_10220 [Advenella sp. WQ 585]|uniref:RES domain-containing protein n=1 Tax=Advenella mandrilli TaxID=2800330 RepID=A0ABS1ECD0_9BURK|nr:hypothetical protein [Advenella mandrilli]MBK1781594.1 hypothetical protein [Advenella mandrilli]